MNIEDPNKNSISQQRNRREETRRTKEAERLEIEPYLSSIADHAQKTGCVIDSEAIKSRMQRIFLKYEKPVAVARIVADNFKKFIRIPFNEKQFSSFLCYIDPGYMSEYDEIEELGITEDGFLAAKPSPEEISEYNEDKKAFLKNKAEMYNKNFETFLNFAEGYRILQSDVFQKTAELNRKDYLIRPKPRIISTPLGGQPGYKIKRKFK